MAFRLRPVYLALILTAWSTLCLSSAFAQTCTVRTQAELLFMFSSCAAQGQPPGCITPQDMQDLICSIPSLSGGAGVTPGGNPNDVQVNSGGTALGGRPLSSKFTTSGPIDLVPGILPVPGVATGIITGSANSGSAATFMRSDAVPALSQTGVGSGTFTNPTVSFDPYGRALSVASGPIPFAVSNNLSEGNPVSMRSNLGLGSLATVNSPNPVLSGGTGATAAGPTAANNIGAFAIGNNLSEGTPATMRGNLGLGSMATQAASAVNITGATLITGLPAPVNPSDAARLQDVTGLARVTSVALSVPATSIFGVTGSPVSSSGTLGLTTTGNSGGIPYFSSTSQLNSSSLLGAGLPVFGGGAGAAPATGTLSGTGTKLVTAGAGAFVSGHALVADASGNAIDGGAFPGGVASVGLSAPTGFSVTGSPVAGSGASGTLGLTLTNENANTIWAGPTTGVPALPTFRTMVVADIPTGIPLTDLASQAANTTVGNATAGTAVPTALVMPSCADSSGNHLNWVSGTGFTCGTTSSSGSPLSGMTATQIPVAATGTTVTSSVPQSTWLFSSGANSSLAGTGVRCMHADATGAVSPASGDCAAGGSGSVTSVAQTVPPEFTLTGSPITTSGTLAIGKATEAANLVWAGPTTGAATAPTFRALVNNDLPSAGALTLGTTSMALGSTTPSVAALTLTASPSLALRDTSAAFDVTLGATSSPVLSAGRALTFDVENGARTVHLGSNLTITTDPGAVTGALKSNGTGTFSQAGCADLAGVGSGCSGTLPAGANPSATIGATTVNGSAATFMRSDAAPAIGANAVTLPLLAQPTANTLIGNVTGALANATYVPVPSCTDTGGNHLNYTSGTGLSCGTSSSAGGSGLSGMTAGQAAVAGSASTITSSIPIATTPTANALVQLNGSGIVNPAMLNAIPNASLANSSFTIGSTLMSLGSTQAIFAGMTLTAPVLTGVPKMTGISPGAAVANLGLDASNNVVSFSPGADTVNPSVTAAGSNSSNCQPLTAQFSNVTSVLTGTGVCLQTGTAGGHSIVRNSGANPLFVYAISTAVINNLAATVGMVVQPNQSLYFEALSATQWYTIP